MHASALAEVGKSAETVGFLALAYYELASRYSSVGPRLDGSELLDDFEAQDDQISFLTMVASDALGESDWRLVRWLGRDRGLLPDDLDRGYSVEDFEPRGEFEPWRLEAALHALAAGGKMERLDALAPIPAEQVLAFAERWQDVEDAIDRWRALGLTATREEVCDTHLKAVASATGRSRLEVYDDWLDAPT